MKQNIIIVDNFYENPYEVRQYALSLEYPQPQDGYTYPGRNSNGTFYNQEIHDKFENLIGRHLVPADCGNHGDFRLSLEADTFQQDIHNEIDLILPVEENAIFLLQFLASVSE